MKPFIRLGGRGVDADLRITRELKMLLSADDLECVPTVQDLVYDEKHREFYVLKAKSPLDRRDLFSRVESEGPGVVETLAKCLAELHDRRIVYRNVRPNAIGVSASGVPVLFDFHLAHRFDETRMVPALDNGSPYDAPEVRESTYDGVRAEIYSLGALLTEKCQSFLNISELRKVVTDLTAREPPERPSSMVQVFDKLGNVFRPGT